MKDDFFRNISGDSLIIVVGSIEVVGAEYVAL
jgi:hypothetical protein